MCSLLRKKYQKSKSKKKKIRQKNKRKKIVKENRRYRKGAHKEHSIALLFVVSFALFISVATFNTCFLSSLFPLLFITTGDRNTYRPATRTSALDIYSILLSVTDLCATHTHIYIYFSCLPSSTYILQISTEKRSLQSRYHYLIGITNQPPVVPPTACIGKNFVRAW